MRDRAYWLFALVAWPAAAWGCLEVIFRVAANDFDGMSSLLILTCSAWATIFAARWRRAKLQPARAGSRSEQ